MAEPTSWASSDGNAVQVPKTGSLSKKANQEPCAEAIL